MHALFHGRKVVSIQNDDIALSMTLEGGHIAQLVDRRSGISPLWVPHWKSVEPSIYSPSKHPEFGDRNEAHLLAGLMGHSLSLDVFGEPGSEEAAAGIPVHGEASYARYDIESGEDRLSARAVLPHSQLEFEREIHLTGPFVQFRETVTNCASFDRPIAWTQHVTLGRPFLEHGVTEFDMSADRSRVFEGPFNDGAGNQLAGADFDWPLCPMRDGNNEDLSRMTTSSRSGGFTAHRMLPDRQFSFFSAYSPTSKLAFSYIWKTNDFPWLARWEENHLRTHAPWNGDELALGMEFGVSPMTESRQKMVSRSPMFDTPTFRWLPAKAKFSVQYYACIFPADGLPKNVISNIPHSQPSGASL